jgi:hypothetical protein
MRAEGQARAEEIVPCIAEPGQQLFTRARSVVSRAVGGGILVVPVRAVVGSPASIYSLKGAGSFIWQLLDVPRAVPELVAAVEREFGVRREQAQKDVTQFLEDMLSVGLVQTCKRVEVTAIEMAATETQGLLETADSL